MWSGGSRVPLGVSHTNRNSPLKWAEPPGGRVSFELAGNLHHPTVFFSDIIDIMPQRISTQQKLKQQQVVRLGLSISSPHWIFEKKKMISRQKFLGQLHQKTHLWAFRSAPRNLPPQKLPPLRNKGWIIGLPSSLYTIRPYQPLFFGETFHALFTVRRLKSSPATPTHEPSRVVRKGFFWNPATFPY